MIEQTRTEAPPAWGKVIDHTRCIGCHACTTACKSENEVPLSVTRTYVKYVDVGMYPATRRSFQVTRCNQCTDAPCTVACPTAAMFTRPDGIVDFDKSICIGCKACIAACPYDAIFINPEDHSAEKCNFCAHRLDVGLEPACVVVCPTQAILVGDLNDPESEVGRITGREAVSVRRPEKETRPKLFYLGAHGATLDPLAAQRPPGDMFMWSEQPESTSGHPGEPSWSSSAAAVLAYDIEHKAPWDFRVSLYTWTKSIAAGAYLVPLGLAVLGLLGWSSPLWTTAAPILGLVFLIATAGLLIWDLEHPERFYMVLTRPQWKSWLVRGGFILTGFGGALLAHFVLARSGGDGPTALLGWVGAPLAVLTAIYTAFLFQQSKARDFWQNPLIAPHLLVQAVLAGSGALALTAPLFGVAVDPPLRWLFAGACAVHLLLVAGESLSAPPTAHARLAHHEMVAGRFRRAFWAGALLAAVGVATPWIGVWGLPAGLIGLLAFEHAYVQAGQSVPLA